MAWAGLAVGMVGVAVDVVLDREDGEEAQGATEAETVQTP